MPRQQATPVTLSRAEQQELVRLVRGLQTPRQVAVRARIILAAAAQQTNSAIARAVQQDEDTVRLWRTRWATATGGSASERLADAPRSGAPVRITADQVCQIVAVACEAPAGSARPISHWSGRELAAEAIARKIVVTLSPRHAARLLKRGISSPTASGIG